MSEIWNFSASSQDLLLICMAASHKHEDNKWSKEFGHLTRKLLDDIQIGQTPPENSLPVEIPPENDTKEDKACICVPNDVELSECNDQNVEEIVDCLETEFSSKVDTIVEECKNNHKLLPTLAVKLSINAIDKLCKHICDNTDINNDFIAQYLQYFLPAYIKRAYNSCTLDILVITHKKYPLRFKLLLEILIKDSDIPKQVLQDLIQSYNEVDRSNFIVDLSEFDLTSEQFSSNILSIYNAYKDCKKSERIQIYVQSLLIQHSQSCVSDRHFGRLLLTFLQTQKLLKITTSGESIRKMVETHRSPFKRPCETLLKELMGEKDISESMSDSD